MINTNIQESSTSSTSGERLLRGGGKIWSGVFQVLGGGGGIYIELVYFFSMSDAQDSRMDGANSFSVRFIGVFLIGIGK